MFFSFQITVVICSFVFGVIIYLQYLVKGRLFRFQAVLTAVNNFLTSVALWLLSTCSFASCSFLTDITSVISKGSQNGWCLKSELVPGASFCYICGLETFSGLYVVHCKI